MPVGGATQVASLFGRLTLDDQMTPALQRSQRSAQGFGAGIQRAIVPAALAVGAALVGGAAAAVRASMEWESAFAGVLKTVDGTPEQLAEVEAGLRSLATSDVTGSLENAHVTLAAVAEAAGQLGVATGDIVSFTSTMAMLGMTTNLTAEDAAFMIAQFQNITGMDPANVERFGSALVALGNNAATTEKDILEMASRLAGAGSLAGMTEANILALSTAMSSVGLNAEAGGTAMTQVMNTITTAVAEGSTELETFARVSGWSAEQFAQGWRNEPISALNDFIVGLGNLPADEQIAILDELGLSGIRTSDTLRRLAGSSELLGDMVALSNEAWNENTALVDEAGKRAATTESQFAILKNSVNDVAITIGNALLPLVNGFVSGLNDWINQIGAAAAAGDELKALELGFQGVGTVIEDVVTGIADFVGGAIADLLGLDWVGAQEGVNMFFGAIEGLVGLLRDQFETAIADVVNAISSWWANVSAGVTQFAEGVSTALAPVVAFIEGIVGAIQEVQAALAAGFTPNGPPPTFSGLVGGSGAAFMIREQRAAGGPVAAGTPYIVGEEGAELFVPSSSGQIVPNHALGGSINVYLTAYGSSPYELLEMVRRAARDAAR